METSMAFEPVVSVVVMGCVLPFGWCNLSGKNYCSLYFFKEPAQITHGIQQWPTVICDHVTSGFRSLLYCLLSINKHHASLVLCWLDARTTAASSSSHTQPLSLLSPSLSVFLSLSRTQLVWLDTKTFSVTTAGYLLIIGVICSSCICVKQQAVGRKQNTMRFI